MVLLNQVKRRHVTQLGVLRRLEVVKDRPAGDDGERLLLYAEALERAGIEVPLEPLPAVVDGEDPVLKGVVVPLLSHGCRHGCLPTPLQEDLLGSKGDDHLRHILLYTLSGAKLARGEIKECGTGAPALRHQGTEEVIGPGIQHRILHRQSRRHQLRHIPLYQGLGELGILDLVTDGDSLPLRYQLRQVDIECMVGETGEGDLRGTTIGPLGQCDPQ